MKHLIVFIMLLTLSGCITKNISGRMYNLDDGSIIEVSLKNYHLGYGKAAATLANGEFLIGEYTLSKTTAPQTPIPHTGPALPSESKVELGAASVIPGNEDPSWSEVYGYSRNGRATPVGTATLIGDRGTLINIVLFSADTIRAVGDGVARTNRGEWYRVHLGNLSEE